MKTSHISGTIFLFYLLWIPFLLQTQTFTPVRSFENEDQQSHTRFNHVISGEATFMPDGVPFEGLKISFSGVGETTVGADGTYMMEVPRYWSGVATPYLCSAGGYAFDPPQIEYVDVRFDFPDQDYAGEALTNYTISGTFYDKFTGEPLANTEIKFNLTGVNQTEEMYVTTNDLGQYSFEKLPCWGDTLDPYLSGNYYFEPMKRGYSGLGSDMANQDYEVTYYEYPLPQGWEVVNTGSFAFIAIENTSDPDICGEPLEVGDLLGVFFTDDEGVLKCGGFTRWQDETNGFISAQGDDNTTDEKDGFTGGEEYTWKIYSYNSQKEFPASVEVVSGNNVFYSLGLTKIGALDGLNENEIWIKEGWSGISSFTMPDIFPALITKVMSPISDELIILQDLEKMYYPAAGINNLILWKYKQGYKIKVSEDVWLPMTGCQEEDRTVDLEALWNIMPVLSDCPLSVAAFFQPVLDDLILVKEIGGSGLYWPDLNIQSLYMLNPGKAYMVAVSGNTSVTFTDCESQKTGSEEVECQNITPWEIPHSTGSTHSFAILREAPTDLETGDFIGAFSESGVCVGLADINTSDKNIPITVFGKDPQGSNSYGAEVDEMINFRAYKSQTGEIVNLMASYSQEYPHSGGLFADNGLSVITELKVQHTSIHAPDFQILISPNPGNGLIKINPTPGIPFLLSISDLNGRILLSRNMDGNAVIDASKLSRGVYLVRAENQKFIRTEKLIIK